MLKIFGIENSRAFRVYWMARELGVPFESIPVHFAGPDIRSPQYLDVNPNGRIPAIEDGSLCLFESMAINLYLAKSRGGPLAPRDPGEDAVMVQWSIWAMTEIERDLLVAMLNRSVFREADRSIKEEARALDNLQRPLKVLDEVLSCRSWLVDDRFTVADLNVASVASLARLGDIELGATPHVESWLDRCLSRPACGWEVQRLPRGLPRPPQMAL